MNEKLNPKWYKKYLSIYHVAEGQVPARVVQEIALKLKSLQHDKPLVTISVIAYNEEKNLWACLWSLSDFSTKYPVEIIGVNNNSTDKTEEIFKKAGIPYFNEMQNGCGFARKCGLQHARGKYHLNIDADTLYPAHYVDVMVEGLERPGVVAVSSSWGYVPDENHSKISLWFYEAFRDVFLFLQSIKRPELSVRGLVFGYHTDLARKVGIRTDIIRGEDGSLALGLKKYGKIMFIRNGLARAITGYGTLTADGSFYNSFKIRFIRAIKQFPFLWRKKSYYKDDESNLLERNKKRKT